MSNNIAQNYINEYSLYHLQFVAFIVRETNVAFCLSLY